MIPVPFQSKYAEIPVKLKLMPVGGKLVFLPLLFLLLEEFLSGHLRKRPCDKITLLRQLQRFSQIFRNPPASALLPDFPESA